MIKLPVSARFLALTLIVSATSVLAAKKALPEPPKEPAKIQIDKCFAVLTKIPMGVASTFEMYPWGLNDTAEVTEVLLGSREADADQLIVRFLEKDYEVPVRTRLDALLIEHRAIFTPSMIYTTFGGRDTPRVATRLELVDDTDLSDSSLTPSYVLGPLTLAGVNEIVEVSTLETPDKSETGTLVVKIRVGQKIHKVILASEIDSLIFLAAHRLNLPVILTAKQNGKGYKVRTFVADADPETKALNPSLVALLEDFKLPVSIIKTLTNKTDAATGLQTLQIQFIDPTIPSFRMGANYTTIESRSELDAVKTLESLISSEKVHFAIEAKRHESGKGFTNLFKFENDLKP